MTFAPQPDAPLQGHSGMATPAKAAWLHTASSLAELQAAQEFAAQRELDLLVLGEGSNTVFTQDFSGLVVLNQLRGIRMVEETADSVLLDVAAGENWHQFVIYCLEQGWFGLENLALIPGSVGAAPMQNIGAYGVEVKDSIQSVTYVTHEQPKEQMLNAQDCEFEYRDSVFKHRLAGSATITSVRFKLSKYAQVNLSYAPLSDRFKNSSPTAREVFDAVCQIRSAKLPLPAELPNCGSFFKNPVVSEVKFKELQEECPEIVGFETADGIKLAAAWLIERRGWKEKSLQGVRVHKEQALVITNPNRSAGEIVMKYAHQIRQDILDWSGIELEVEPRIY